MMNFIASFFNALATSFSLFLDILRDNLLKAVVAAICIIALAFALMLRGKNSEKIEEREIVEIPAHPVEPLKDDFLLSTDFADDVWEFRAIREPQAQWTEEEAKKWFIAPDSQTLDELHTANNSAVSEILEGVP